MASKARLDQIINELNDALGDVTPYRLAVVNPKDIKPVPKNAHYMNKRTFDQLVQNIQRDKNLSSLPFCWRRGDEYTVLSGNHRVSAAVTAGVPLILVLYTSDDLNRAAQVAIQLSHNAIVGQDNPNQLIELWNEIDDVQLKIYSGLDDLLLKTLEQPAVIRINEETLRFEELNILFIPSEAARFEEILKRLQPLAKKRLLADVSSFDMFFDALLNLKQATGIINTATAFMFLAELAEKYIAEQESTGEN